MGGGLHGGGFLGRKFLGRKFIRWGFLGWGFLGRLPWQRLNGRDDTIDALRHAIFRKGISKMMEDPRDISHCTYYIMVARYLERRGDHACKIAENVHYMETGEQIEIH